MKFGLIRRSNLRPVVLTGLCAVLPLVASFACSDDTNSDNSGGQGGAPDDGSRDTGGTGSGATGGGDTGGTSSGATGGGDSLGGGGGDESDDDDVIPQLHVSTIEELTDKSSPDYGDNEHGVISGGRLKRWINDWENERPAGIEGRLVIIQVVPSNVTTSLHLAANEAEGVFVHLINSNEFNTARNNGLSGFETDIPDGAAADNWLKKWNIDPRKDLIVLTFEQQANTTNAIVQSVGRAWVFLKYWGIATDHLAILNGSIDWNATNHGIATAPAAQQKFSKPTNNGQTTVRHLGRDNTALSISLEEILAILSEDEGAAPLEGVRIVDARGGAEAYGLDRATSTGRTDCANWDVLGNDLTSGTAADITASKADNKCSTPFEGRIKGAKSVPWTQFIDTAPNGFRFLPYTTVKSTFDSQSGWNASADLTVQYCRTNQRSTVTAIVANVILGYPTRLYETSFIEWGHASAGPGADGVGGAPAEDDPRALVGSEFAFRTDLAEFTEHAELTAAGALKYPIAGRPITGAGTLIETTDFTWVAGPNYNEIGDVSPLAGTWPASGWPSINPEATTTRLSIDTDRAYLRDIPLEELDD